MSDGELVKAKIVNDDTKEELMCIFNPKEYVFSKQNKWQEKPAKGKNVAHLEYGGGAPASLKLQLLFDTYEDHGELGLKVRAGEDVRTYTKVLWDMMKPSDKKKNKATGKGEPPFVKFEWGKLWSFMAVIDSLSVKYTMFLPDGTPVRAVADISFKQITDEGQYPKQNPTSGGNPGEHLRLVREGETLAWIAYEEYGDSTAWRHIAELNGIDDPRRLQPGQALIIAPIREG
jgi:hypothetical protein